MRNVPGWVYILHIDPPLAHARHYVGWSVDPGRRAREHASGQGSPLIKAALAQGSQITLGGLDRGTRADERRIKRGKNVSRHCAVCDFARKNTHPTYK